MANHNVSLILLEFESNQEETNHKFKFDLSCKEKRVISIHMILSDMGYRMPEFMKLTGTLE